MPNVQVVTTSLNIWTLLNNTLGWNWSKKISNDSILIVEVFAKINLALFLCIEIMFAQNSKNAIFTDLSYYGIRTQFLQNHPLAVFQQDIKW